jgi:lipoate-protein ligase B
MQEARELWVVPLGTRPYTEVWELQRALAHRRIAGEIPQDLLLLVEHPPVITLGRSARDPSTLLATPELLRARGVELFEVERGGDVTFHGPGQLVGYPIVDLNRHKLDLHWYLRQIEGALIDALLPCGITGERSAGQTGVWTEGRKIASIGVHARQWVTWHGFALNVTTDLSYFDLMVPCGIAGVQMTTVSEERRRHGAPVAEDLMADVVRQVVRTFAETFALTPRTVESADLLTTASTPS